MSAVDKATIQRKGCFTLIGYILLNFNWKKRAKPHAEKYYYILKVDLFFQFQVQEKIIILFSFIVIYFNQDLHF